MAWGYKRARRQIGTFLRQYSRTSRRPGMDPNDRHYNRDLEKMVKRMSPDELDRAAAGEFDDERDPD